MIKVNEPVGVNQVWMTGAGNLFRVDQIEGGQASVTRLGYESAGIARLSPKADSHVFPVSSFPLMGRIVAHNAQKFERWLKQRAVLAVIILAFAIGAFAQGNRFSSLTGSVQGIQPCTTDMDCEQKNPEIARQEVSAGQASVIISGPIADGHTKAGKAWWYCEGTTKAGKRCKRHVVEAGLVCAQHHPKHGELPAAQPQGISIRDARQRVAGRFQIGGRPAHRQRVAWLCSTA